MRVENKEIKIYKFDELEEKAQDEILNNWRNNDSFFWGDELIDSLKAFTDLFDITNLDYQLGLYNSYINYSFNFEDEILNMNYIRLHKWINNNYYNDITTKKYKIKNGKIIYSKNEREFYSCPFTGVCFDNDILDPLCDFMKKPYNINIENLMEKCLNSWKNVYTNELEDWYSEECIKKEIDLNDYEFTSDGKIYQ